MSSTVRLCAASAVGLAISGLGFGSPAAAKMPGHTYCFHDTCHTVKTLEETRRLVGVTTKMKASFYDDPKHDAYNPSNLTSSGEYFRSDRPDNAASPIYPDGTKLLVWHPDSGKALMIRVNNAGPYWGDRKLDLSRAAAEKFGFTRRGVATVHVKVVEAPSVAEATYRRGRSYPPVKGYLGQFASLEAAAAGVAAPITRLAANTPQPALAVRPKLDAAAEVLAERPRVVANATAIPKAKAPRLTPLDLKLASEVEREVRKFRVAQR